MTTAGEGRPATGTQPPSYAPAQGYYAIVWRQFWRRRLNRAALWVILVLVLLALAADLLASDRPLVLSFEGRLYLLPNLIYYPELQIFDLPLLRQSMRPGDWAILPVVPWGYNTHDLSQVLQPPSAAHWLGTDASGRDVLARVIHGTRVSLSVGVMAVGVLVSIGVLLGSLAGYYGGLCDSLLMRLVEIVHSLPTILLLVVTLAVIAPQGWGAVFSMMAVIGAVGWTSVARLIRGEILRVKTLDYVQASRAQGASSWRVIVRHVIPNSLSPVLVAATFSMAAAILIEGALSFLGFGIPADMASWGGLLQQVRGSPQAWWIAVFPGFAIFLTVTVYNVAGEGLRDAIDPRLKA
jgi:peptide/nickel transport system permease protein